MMKITEVTDEELAAAGPAARAIVEKERAAKGLPPLTKRHVLERGLLWDVFHCEGTDHVGELQLQFCGQHDFEYDEVEWSDGYENRQQDIDDFDGDPKANGHVLMLATCRPGHPNNSVPDKVIEQCRAAIRELVTSWDRPEGFDKKCPECEREAVAEEIHMVCQKCGYQVGGEWP